MPSDWTCRQYADILENTMATANARMYVELRDNSITQFIQVSKRRAKFALKEGMANVENITTWMQHVERGEASSAGTPDTQESKKQACHEIDLHILLSSFVRADALPLLDEDQLP